MSLVPCIVPAAGYLTVAPPRDLGTDLVRALRAAGVPFGGAVRRPRGYALLLPAARRVRRLPAATRDQARTEAVRLARTAGPVVIARAVGEGRATLYAREEVVSIAPAAAVLAKARRVLTDSGRALAPGVDIYEGADLRLIAQHLAGQLRAATRRALLPQVRAALEALDVDWAALTPAAADSAWAAATRALRAAPPEDVLPQWEGRLVATALIVARAARTRLKDTYLPRIGVSLQRSEAAAVARIGTQAGWFLRDRAGAISAPLTARGREIVAAGLRDGLGRAAIGAELRAQLPALATRWGTNYATTAAANAVSRARSWAEITAYRSAGITVFEAQAVLDERTTEYCFFRDTMISIPTGESKICSLKPGDYIITGMGLKRKIIGVITRSVKKIIRLTISSGHIIMVTPNHPLLTAKGWVKVNDLRKGDCVASKGTEKTGFLGNDDMRVVRKEIRDKKDLCRPRTNALLLNGMPPRKPAEGSSSGALYEDVHCVRKIFPGAPWFDMEGSKTLLNEMSSAARGSSVHGMRKDVHSKNFQHPEENILLDRMQRAKSRDDKYRALGGGYTAQSKNTIREGSLDRKSILYRLRGTKNQSRHRSGRRILAPRSSLEGSRSAAIIGAEGRSHKGQWNEIAPHRWKKTEKVSKGNKGRSGTKELHYSAYFQRAIEWVTIVRREDLTGIFEVFNLEIDEDPTYIAEGVIAHNCRFIDGQIVDVQGAYDIMERAASVTNPEDIYHTSPFLTTVGDEIRTTTGTPIAQIVRSGVGNVDDRGQFNAKIMGRDLPHAHIGMPPYHHACRTYTVPRVESWQVPVGYEARSAPLRPIASAPRAAAVAVGGALAARSIFAPSERPPAAPRPSVARPPQRPLEFVPAPRPNRYTPLGEPRPVDAYALPALVDRAAPEAERLVAQRDVVAAVRTLVPAPGGARALVASGPYRAVPAAEGLLGGAVFRSAEGYADVYAQVHLARPARALDLAALAVHPDAYGRHLVYAVRGRYLRLHPERFPRRAANALLRRLEAGAVDEAAAQRFLDDGVRRGWLRIGDRLEDVSVAAHARDAAAAGAAMPGPLPARARPRPDRPAAAAAKGARIYLALQDDGAAIASPLGAAPVGPAVYAHRPPGAAMARAAWAGSYGLVRPLAVGPDGAVAPTGGWQRTPLSGGYAAVPAMERATVPGAARVVSVYCPRTVGPVERDLLLARAVEAEIAWGARGTRDYVIHDVRGVATFVRVDAAAAARHPAIATALEAVMRGEAAARGDLRARGIAAEEDLLARAYPEAVVAWDRPGLLPGVPLADQVARRVDAVRREIDERVRVAQGGRTRFPNRAAFADVLRVAAKLGAAPGRPTEHLRTSDNDIVRGRARRAMDAMLEHASGPLLLALQTLPLPIFGAAPDGVNRYVVPADLGGAATPGRALLRPQDALAVGWGRAGRWTDGQRRQSRARVRRVLQHHVDRVGCNAAAGRLMRNRLIGDGSPAPLFGAGTPPAPPGAWADAYDARAYGGDAAALAAGGMDTGRATRRALDALVTRDIARGTPQACEWGAAAHACMARDDPRELQLVWETAPTLLAGYVALMRGAFVPFAEE